MRFDGMKAQVEPIGDVLIAVAFGEELIDLPLTVGQQLEAVLGLVYIFQPRQSVMEDLSHRGAEECQALFDGMDRLDQLLAGRILEQISPGAGFDRTEHVPPSLASA